MAANGMLPVKRAACFADGQRPVNRESIGLQGECQDIVGPVALKVGHEVLVLDANLLEKRPQPGGGLFLAKLMCDFRAE